MSSPLQPQLVKDIDAALARIQAAEPSAAGPHWGAMHKLLLKAKIDPQAIMRLVGARDTAELTRAVARAKGEAALLDDVRHSGLHRDDGHRGSVDIERHSLAGADRQRTGGDQRDEQCGHDEAKGSRGLQLGQHITGR